MRVKRCLLTNALVHKTKDEKPPQMQESVRSGFCLILLYFFNKDGIRQQGRSGKSGIRGIEARKSSEEKGINEG